MPTPRTVFIASIILFIAAAAVGYWYLGGFREPSVEVVEHQGYRLLGNYYSGKSGSSEAQELFRDIASLSQSGAVAGTMAVVVLHEATEEQDSVHQFIGILLSERGAALPRQADSLQLLEIPNYSAVRVELEASSLVWPSPDKITARAREFAAQNKLSLAPDLIIEKYVSPGRLQVELPLEYRRPRAGSSPVPDN